MLGILLCNIWLFTHNNSSNRQSSQFTHSSHRLFARPLLLRRPFLLGTPIKSSIAELKLLPAPFRPVRNASTASATLSCRTGFPLASKRAGSSIVSLESSEAGELVRLPERRRCSLVGVELSISESECVSLGGGSSAHWTDLPGCEREDSSSEG